MENYRKINPEHEEIHEKLQKWANWAKNHWHPQTCQSLEGNYRPPPMFEEPTPQFLPDLQSIYNIEYIVVNAPMKYGQHLVYWYIRKWPHEAIKCRLRIRRSRMCPHLWEAREWVKNLLTG